MGSNPSASVFICESIWSSTPRGSEPKGNDPDPSHLLSCAQKIRVVAFSSEPSVFGLVIYRCMVEAIQVHHLRPRGDEVLHELLLRIRTSVHLGQSSQLRVRAED